MKPLLDLAPSDCRWPVTDTKPFLFCGLPRAAPSSYCACHKAMSVSADQPAPYNAARTRGIADTFAGARLVSRQKAAASTQRMPIDQHMKLNRCAGKTAWGIE